MEDHIDFEKPKILGIGDKVPELVIKVYDTVEKKFKEINIYKDILSKGKFLVLFYYPADFTFVCPTELEDLFLGIMI